MLSDPRVVRGSAPQKHPKDTTNTNKHHSKHTIHVVASHTIVLDEPSSPPYSPARRTASLPAGHPAFTQPDHNILARRLSTPLAALRITLSGNNAVHGMGV